MTNYDKLTKLFNQVPRHDYSYNYKDISKNGIYVMFEKSEKHLNFDRVVRIGSHNSANRLLTRIAEHYVGTDHRDSIFRKHLGRSFLTVDKQSSYIKTWDFKIKKIADKAKNYNKINWTLENIYEDKVTDYIQKNLTFIVIPNLIDATKRLRLEKGLIATFAQSLEKTISTNWFGKFHPDFRINNSGLWNIQHLKGTPLTDEEIKFVDERLK